MFNFSKKLAFGIDLSDASLKMVQLKNDTGKLSISNFVKIDVPEGLVEEGIIKKEDKLIPIFKEALNNSKRDSFKGKGVVCSLPEEKVFVRVIKIPKMKEEELSEAIKWEAEAHIPLSIDDVYFDWSVIKTKEDSNNSNILITAAPKDIVDKYVSFLKKINLIPIAFEPESFSVIRSLIKKDDLIPTIIIDLGATGTNFVIFSGSDIRFTSHISISGNLLNNKIAEKMKVSLKKANEFKIKYGLEDKENDLGVESIIDDLVNQIKDYIVFYNDQIIDANEQKKDISRIMLCGGDSYLLGLPENLSSKLNLPVELGNPLINIDDKGEKSLKKMIVYTTAIGLALREVI